MRKISYLIFPAEIKVYNFTVGEYHNYAVADAGVLVHNRALYNPVKDPISMEDALIKANDFFDTRFPIRSIDQPQGVQFIQDLPNGITKRVGFDLNPNSPHVKNMGGPHLNLQTQVNGKIIKNGPLSDPHIPIDPKTVIKNDY